MFVCLKGLGKFRKSKAYGLVGCLTLSAVIGLAAPELPIIGGGVVSADVIQGGSDIHDVDVHSKSAEGVAMTYTTYDSGTSGKQTASGSGVFVAPNVMVTVAHNYYDKNQEDKSAVLRGGESARSYVVMNSETEKSNKVPTSGVSESLEKDSIHLYDEKNFGKEYGNDLAVVVTKKPVEAMTGGEDSPRELSDKEVSTGDSITMVGYPNDFSTPNLSKENKARLKDGKAYSVSTTVSSVNKESGAVTYHSSALGGFSGAPLFNDKGEVVGIHQHGTNTSSAPESERIGGGTIFTDKHRAWIRSMIDKYGIKGWYIDGANRYYYDENHIALKDVESEIDGALYSFDEKGRATLVKGEEKGRVLLRVEDTKGTRLISDKVVQEGPVGSGLNFHLRQNPDFKQLIATSPTAKVVSYNGVSINKLASDTTWSDDYVSKLALGNTIIRAVVDSITPPSTSSSDFARTEVGKVDLSGKSNLPVPSKEVLQAPNGSENFYATTHIQTPDGSGSGTLIAPNLVLTVAHNFLTVKGSEVVTKSGRTNTVYKATLPNGLSVNFSDDDIVYWNKKDSVFGFKNDLALVRLKEEVKGVTPVEVVKRSSKVAEGDSVSVYGFPDNKLSPVLDSKVVGTTDFGSGIEGISYGGTKPGASGGGLYNDKGALIGVHQNGVVGSRSGGLVLSKEQLDWVRSYIEGQPKDPVYVEDKEVEPSKKDSDKDLAGKLDPKKDSGKEDSGILGTSGDFATPTVSKPEFTGGVNGGDSLVTEVPEYSGIISTLGDSPAPTVAKPEYMGDTLSSSGEDSAPTVEQHDFTGGVNGGDSLVTEVPEYSGVLSTLGDFPAPTVEQHDFTGGVPFTESPILEIPEYMGPLSTSGEGSSVVKSTDKQVNNKDSKDEAETKNVITGIASSQRILKNETGSIQIQASEEVLKNVIGIQMQEVQVSDLSSLNYKAFDIKLKDVNGRYVKLEGKVLVTFATDQSVENVYAVDPEGKLHTIEFEQKVGKIIFEINNSSIYAMTFRRSIDNLPFKNPTEDNKVEELSLSSKLLSTNENSGFSQSENKVGNNEQAKLPDTGENKSITTVLLGFVGMFLGAMISYKRKDS
ncbi:SIALI-17 repeat-containing surface protein [Streptococcus mitis]|uniref:SIALI-17 repeat-containing surface protein n=1 Tax=Streptococcus mitis TaxID=28037 RepID=UPI0021BD4C8D|nr:SIALI-17 repeat-containing surface protein [Streptococcus mitis]